MAWFKKQRRQDSAGRKTSRTTRICRFEQMESRLMLSADPIHIGAVFTETSSTSFETEGDRFEIAWTGGAEGTQLTQLEISGDINQNGILDNGDVFFDVDGDAPGVGPYFPFTIADDSDIKAEDITYWSLSPDKTTITIHVQGWEAGEKLIFLVDVDELDSAPNSLVDGAEFQGSTLTATWVDTNGHHDDLTATGTFYDDYDHMIDSSVDVPLDANLPPAEGTNERTAGTGFSAQQQVTPFTISGTVYHDVDLDGQHDTGEVGIPDVELSLYRFNEDTGLWEDTGLRSTTDSNGNFSFTSNEPGKYRIVETQPDGYFSTGSTAGSGGTVANHDVITDIELLGGEHSTGHKFGEALPGTLSGHVYHDADNDGIKDAGETGIGGVQIRIDAVGSGGSSPIFTTTDADGSWSVGNLDPTQVYTVTEIQPSGGWLDGKDSIGSLGGVFAGNDTITNVSFTASGQHGQQYNFGELLPASLTGRVFADHNDNVIFDGSDYGIAGVTVQLLDADGNVVQSTVTDANGYYTFTDLTPGATYAIRELQPTNYFDGGEKAGTAGGDTSVNDHIKFITLASNEKATGYDFAELPPASLSGYVYGDLNNSGTKDGGEPGLANVEMELVDADGNVVRTTKTDSNGFYKFDNLEHGTYTVRQAEQPTGWFDGLDTAGSAGGTPHNPGDRITGVSLAIGEVATNYNFGELPPASLSGYVYGDLNNSGTKDGGEPGLANVEMELVDADGNVVRTTKTDSNGFYKFDNLEHGTYTVRQVEQPTGWFDGLDTAGSAGGTPQNPGDMITSVSLAPGQDATNYNFGELPPASLSGYVYGDMNNSGTRDSGEPGLANVEMELVDADGNVVRTTKTDSNGFYKFDHLPPGVYTVRQVEQPAGWYDGQESAGSVGGTPDNPGDSIRDITLNQGVHAVNYNFGELPPGSIAGYVFRDDDGDCHRDPGEPGIANVKIELLDQDGNVVATTFTDSDGQFKFENVAPGVYSLRETQPDGYYDSDDHAGTAGGFAHNPGDLITGIHLSAAQHATDYHFCEVGPGSISGYVFQDGPPVMIRQGQTPSLIELQSQRNGQFTSDDTPLAGVQLFLADANGNLIRDANGNPVTTFTDANGFYRFSGLAPGQYVILQAQPQGYYDGIDTPGTTGGVAANFGNEGHPALAGINHGYNAIAAVTVVGSQESRFNNFSEIAVTEVPFIPPPPPPGPPAPKLPLNEPAPLHFAQGPPIHGAQLVSAPHSNIDLYFGTGGTVQSSAYSWHLSVIDAGNPRGGSAEGESLVSVSDATFDVFTSTHKAELRNGYFVLPQEGLAEDQVLNFGREGAIPIAGDFNGDGFAEVGVFVDGHWYIDLNGNGVWDDGDLWAKLGNAGDLPVVGDWDGDGKDDIGIFGPEWPGDPRAVMSEPGLPDRQNETSGARKNMPPRPYDTSLGHRTLKRTANGELRTDVIDHVFYFGGARDIPVAGDWNGDGVDTIGVFMNGTWILDDNGDGRWLPGETMVELGQAGDMPVVGDFNGDGVTDLGVFRDGKWMIDINGNHTFDPDDLYIEFGQPGDMPVVADWDGDGIDEVGVYRQGVIQRPDL